MQDRPDKEVLLDALANFLLTQVKPAIQDPGLSFRVLIAANLAVVTASEIRGEETQDAAELKRLVELLGSTATPSGRSEMHAAIRGLNRELTEKLRAGSLSADQFAQATAHVRQTLLEKLAVNNPRFDISAEIGD